MDLTAGPAIVSVGAFNGGLRNNIIPDSAVMIGTIRSYDEQTRTELGERLKRTAEGIAQSAGAKADVRVDLGTPATVNDSALTTRMLPVLQRVAGPAQVAEGPLRTNADDFAYFARRAPGLFVFLGGTPLSQDWHSAAPNHSPRFVVDEAALPVGVRTLAHLALDYLAAVH